MPIPLIAGLASLALNAGPSLIRGIASLVGGSETADKVANIVQTVSDLGLGKSDSQAMIESRLQQAFTPEQFVELQRLKADLEREETRRQELQLQDRQSEQAETQTTIRQGDQNQDEYVRRTRPLMARQSWQATAIYVFTMSLLQAFGRGSGADFEMAMMLLTPALAYLGLRTLDGWAPYSKTSGHKVQATISSGIGKLLSRAG